MELNNEQKQVINTLDKNILLIASAGTGKTNTMAQRIASIVEKGLAKPEEILCLTFTNKACNEMRERINEIVGENSLKIIIRTFHSFCYDIIRTEAKRSTDLFVDSIIFDEEDCKEIIKQISNNMGRDWHTDAIWNFISLMKEARIRYGIFSNKANEDYKRTLKILFEKELPKVDTACRKNYKTIHSLVNEMHDIGDRLVCEYNRKLAEDHGLDFTDLMANAYKILLDKTAVDRWQKVYRFINVDEMQDTSEVEYSIISKLFGNNNILFCGDYFQTIYEWRNSNPVKIQKMFEEKYKPEVIIFYENYRATKLLLNASTDYLRNVFGDRMNEIYPHEIIASSKEKGLKILLHGADSDSTEASWIYNEIRKLGIKDYSRVCVLSRSNTYNTYLSQHFASLGNLTDDRLPFFLIDEFRFFRRQEIKDALAFLKIAVNSFDSASLERTLKRFGKGIGEATVAHIQSRKSMESGIQLTDFVDPKTHETGDHYGLLIEAWHKEQIVVFDVESTGVDTTSDDIIQIAAIKLDREGGIRERFVSYVKASKSVGTSELVHHISDKMLEESGRPPKTVFKEFEKFIDGCVIVGHNVTYDINILTSEMSRLGMRQIKIRAFYDTLNIFRRFHPNLENHKLEYLGAHFKVSHKSTHDAFDDICATAEILKYAIENDIIPTTEFRMKETSKYLEKFRAMTEKLETVRELVHVKRPYELMADIVKMFGIKDYYENRKEFKRVQYLRSMYLYMKDWDDPRLPPGDAAQNVLRFTALSNSELDAMLKSKPKIPIITVHQAKGMEFDYVFIAGMMDMTFPNLQAIKEHRLDEESRLFYVAMTRAKSRLYITWCQQCSGKGKYMSRFIDSIPREYIESV